MAHIVIPDTQGSTNRRIKVQASARTKRDPVSTTTKAKEELVVWLKW
jgi:hypothetical protein